MEKSLQNEFKIKFDGELNQIDANTLINSLINVTSIIQEINESFDTKKIIEIKIKALSKGSFLIHFGLEGDTISQSLIIYFLIPILLMGH